MFFLNILIEEMIKKIKMLREQNLPSVHAATQQSESKKMETETVNAISITTQSAPEISNLQTVNNGVVSSMSMFTQPIVQSTELQQVVAVNSAIEASHSKITRDILKLEH